MKDEMTSRERMWAAINRQPVDRVPTDMWTTGEMMEKLKRHFGCESWEVGTHLRVDGFAGVGPAACPPPPPPGWRGDAIWGMETKPVAYEGGVYYETSHHPLAYAKTVDDLMRHRWPQAEWFDFSKVGEAAKAAHAEKVVQAGYMAPFFYQNLTRGLEQSLIDPLEDPEFTHLLLEKLTEYFLAFHRKLFEAADGHIDVAQVTDDLGSQTGPMISLDLYRTFYKPCHMRMIDLCKEFGVKVFHHDDGSCREFLPDLVEMGIDILNPVQWNCPGMETAALKRDFGAKVCFHGGVENQGILPFGTPDDVRAEVRHCIDTLASDGTGYILASCHNLQPNTPIENVIAMYDEAFRYGVLP